VAQPDGPQRVKVGILLAKRPDDLGEWLADAAAFEAAGADALWIDVAPAEELDPLTVTAALAAVTFRSVLVSVLPVSSERSPAVARSLATIGRLSRGRLRILARDLPPGAFAAAGPGLRDLLPSAGSATSFGPAYDLDHAGRWTSAPSPDSRAAWRATLLDAAGSGYRGLLVPADPRLIDILRNPDDPNRLDLHLAAG
jgi:Luciferase-like monooxygenase